MSNKIENVYFLVSCFNFDNSCDEFLLVAERWNKLNARCGKGAYKNIEVRMSKFDWVNFSTPIIEKFLKDFPGDSPSVDRIDPDGHYELGNIRIVSYLENLARSRLNLKKFGITASSPKEKRLLVLLKLFEGNCSAMNLTTQEGLDFLNNNRR